MDLWKDLLRKAYEEATNSPDPSTQNGALVADVARNGTHTSSWHQILGHDHNRLPKGIPNTPEIWNDRALKYKYVHHAERTTLDTTRRVQRLSDLDGYILVCPWAACTDCAKEVIAAGITALVIHKQAHDRTPPDSVWFEDIIIAHQMFRDAKVEIIIYDGKVDGPAVRHSGILWTP
jgi:deoxycytidylate deaminase